MPPIPGVVPRAAAVIGGRRLSAWLPRSPQQPRGVISLNRFAGRRWRSMPGQAAHGVDRPDDPFPIGIVRTGQTSGERRLEFRIHANLARLPPTSSRLNRTWTDRTARAIIATMRFILLSLPLFLGACGAGPAALGITGPGPALPQAPVPGPFEAPPSANQFAPSTGPNSGSGRFWGYN